jgi:hypothetical protein
MTFRNFKNLPTPLKNLKNSDQHEKTGKTYFLNLKIKA